MTLTRQHVSGTGVAAAALTAVALAAGNFGTEGENGGAGPYAITLGASLVLAAALFGWAIPAPSDPPAPA